MPIWFEVIVLMLAAYALGLALGGFVWGKVAVGRARAVRRRRAPQQQERKNP
ncbi:MAG: hypothetical protein ACR2FJ_07345 [Qipengyuania sp.]